jgi:hypothetical protein
MTPGQTKIVERLRKGPLPTNGFREVEVASCASLRVLISRLREQGFDIRVYRTPMGPDARFYLGEYVLIREAPAQ